MRAFLRREPALNTVPLGLISRALVSTEDRARLFAAAVVQDGDIVAAAFRSDFPKLILAAEGRDHQIAELAGLVHSHMPDLPCVLGRDNQVVAFQKEWEGLAGTAGRLGMPQRIHVLDKVQLKVPVPGAMRPARQQDSGLVLDWFTAFEIEAHPAEARSAETRRHTVDRNLEAGGIFLWVDSAPVSMAGAREFGEGVARIGPVYTPPQFRRRGYGGVLTAAVSSRMLDGGCFSCCLFTDLRNRTSNHIYAEIGYVPKADFSEVWFDAL